MFCEKVSVYLDPASAPEGQLNENAIPLGLIFFNKTKGVLTSKEEIVRAF